MFTALITLFGGGLGGLLRFIPEILKLFSEAKDMKHEKEMTELQFKIDDARAVRNLDIIHAQGAQRTDAFDAEAFLEGIKAQGRPSGIKWVDALNASVRPILMYWWQGLFTIIKLCTVWIAITEFTTLAVFIATIWTPEDAGILSMMLGFFFCDRSLRKYRDQ